MKVKSSSGSPFKAYENNTVQDILDRIKKFMPQDIVQFEGSPFIYRNLFYKFHIAYWRKLFQVANYPSIDIVSRVEYVESGIGKYIILVVETEMHNRFHKIKDFI